MSLYLRRRGAVYYFRRVVFLDVRAAFEGETRWMHTLDTKDYGEAQRRRNIRVVETDKLISDARAGIIAVADAYPTPGGTPAPIEMTAEEGRRWEEAMWRNSLEGAEAAYRALEAIERDPVQRLISDARQGAREDSEREQREAREQLRQARKRDAAASWVPLLELFDGYIISPGLAV